MRPLLLSAVLLALPCCEEEPSRPVMDVVCPDGVRKCAHGMECTPDSTSCTSNVFRCQDGVHWCKDGMVCSPDSAQCVRELSWCPDGRHWCKDGIRCTADSRHCGSQDDDGNYFVFTP